MSDRSKFGSHRVVPDSKKKVKKEEKISFGKGRKGAKTKGTNNSALNSDSKIGLKQNTSKCR